jgi:hypothetical protein
MASLNITWTPAGGETSTGQQVQFRKVSTGGDFVTAATLSATADSYALTVDANYRYEVRILNICSTGGPQPSANLETAAIPCFVSAFVQDTATHNEIGFHFETQGGDLNRYIVRLLPASGSTVLQEATYNQSTGTIYHTFSGLTPGTSYKVYVVASISGTHGHSCEMWAPSTSAAPAAPVTCYPPTDVTVSLTAGATAPPPSPAPSNPGISVSSTQLLGVESDTHVQIRWRYHTDGNVAVSGNVSIEIEERNASYYGTNWMTILSGNHEVIVEEWVAKPSPMYGTERHSRTIVSVSGPAVIGNTPEAHADIVP